MPRFFKKKALKIWKNSKKLLLLVANKEHFPIF